MEDRLVAPPSRPLPADRSERTGRTRLLFIPVLGLTTSAAIVAALQCIAVLDAHVRR